MKTNQKELLIEQLRKTPIIQIACEKVGVGRATYYRWRKEDIEFQEQTDIALTEGSLLINDMAESQLMSAIRDRNMTAIIFWLKHHHVAYTTRVEVSAEIHQVNDKLTPEQESVVRAALDLAALPDTSSEHDTEYEIKANRS